MTNGRVVSAFLAAFCSLALAGAATSANGRGGSSSGTPCASPTQRQTQMPGTMTTRGTLRWMSDTGPTGFSNYGGPAHCSSQISHGVTQCLHFVTAGHVTSLRAQRMAGSPMPATCQFVCQCGAIGFDAKDGLPVELLDFEVSAAAPSGS